MPLRSLARKPLPKPDPRSDPRYLRVTQQLKTNATKVKVHPPAAKKAGDAAAASKGPPNERMATGKSKQVEKIQEAKTGKPEPSSFLTLLRAEIEKAMPKTLGDTEKFMQGGKSEELKGGLKGNVSQQKTESTGQVVSASSQQPAPAGEAKQETPLPKDPAAPSPKVPGAEAMPAPKSDADVSLQDSKQDVDQEMKDAKVNDRQLQKANDPRFSAVLDAKGAVAKQADSAPGQYRAQEKGALGSAAAKANTDATKNAARMLGVRSSSGARVLTRQQLQKAKDEAKRKEITDKIEAIYSDTKTRVEKKLADLDGEVNTMFDQGVDNALQVMTDYTETRIRDYKIDRYLSIPLVGQARWIRDQFKGLPEEANAFYEEGRRVFQATMDKLIVRVANLVELRLKEAKALVAKGQADIKAFVASQPKELQQFAQAAAKEVNERFKDLEGSIEDKKNELASSLAGKYKEAFDKANEALKKIQDSNKGLVAAFVEKLGEIIKILREFKDKVMSLLAKARDAIDIIVDDPIGFLGNLIAAIKGGISKFVDNIWEHLKKGFMAWLFGSLPPGIEIPSDFSLPSILKLVLAVLGITYDRMRAKAVKLIGERNVKIIEKVVDYIRTLITGGPAALWEKVKEDLSNLKEMVIEAIMNWLITTLIKKAIEKIISMCNPVGAIIQAIIAIYNLVMFIVEKIQQILAFFEAIVNSIYNIATGNLTAAINWIEQALARMIPLLIGFLARLIGLGGITDKIREFILKIQSKVDKAIDKAIEKIVGFIKGLFGKGGAKEGQAPGPTVEMAFVMKDKSHKLAVKIGSTEKLKMSSDGGALSDKIAAAITKINAVKPVPPNAAERVGVLGTIRTDASAVETDAKNPAIKEDQVKPKLQKVIEDLKSYAKKYGAADVEDVLAGEFPAPDVATYNQLRSRPDKPLPDGKGRQEHHAPPVELANSLGVTLLDAGAEMETAAPGSGANLLEAGRRLQAHTTSAGGKLPAIRVHEQTHKERGGPGLRIHGSELAARLKTELIAKGYSFEELSRKEGTRATKLAVKPGEKTFGRQLALIAKRVAPGLDTKAAVKTKTKEVIGALYRTAADQSLTGVDIAVKASVIDGPADQKSVKLAELRTRAKTIWEDYCLEPIFK